MKIKNATLDYEKAFNAFLDGEKKVFGDKNNFKMGVYVATENALVHRFISQNAGWGGLFYSKASSYNEERIVEQVILARINGKLLGNASSLNASRDEFRGSIHPLQEYLSEKIDMIPFSVFQEADLNLNDFKLIEKGPEKTVSRYMEWEKTKTGKPKVERVHFTGASLFTVGKEYFLFDIDQNEIEHKIFNPFLVKIPKKVKTIAEAYESLKPKAVKKAEADGLEVLRQGEWFFIPVEEDDEDMVNKIRKAYRRDREIYANNTTKKPVLEWYGVDEGSGISSEEIQYSVTRYIECADNAYIEIDGEEGGIEFIENENVFAEALDYIEEDLPTKHAFPTHTKTPEWQWVDHVELQAGDNTPNNAEYGVIEKDKTVFVKGWISHQGREHHDINLKAWYKAIPNTATGSFTITGDID
ncbi:MAG: hypothetical protein DRQ88_06055 [Epsilonproteobacteria bacterium]|nr:MAG: hypothetical protein DRQ88_06055 [Campylobacterota bacterium]